MEALFQYTWKSVWKRKRGGNPLGSGFLYFKLKNTAFSIEINSHYLKWEFWIFQNSLLYLSSVSVCTLIKNIMSNKPQFGLDICYDTKHLIYFTFYVCLHITYSYICSLLFATWKNHVLLLMKLLKTNL